MAKKSRKRTKQTIELINAANQWLKERMVNFENKWDDATFVAMQHILLKTNLYEGFNMYYEKDGRYILVGLEDIPLEKQFIQFY